jgi:ATP dependent DNA ligase-like protein
LYRRAEPHFYAFDLLFLDGRDLRGLPLIQRKAILRGLVPRQPCRLLYVDHLAGYGVDLFEAVCAADLEGIVAKMATAPYGTEPPSWVKIKNRYYSQAAGRRERFGGSGAQVRRDRIAGGDCLGVRWRCGSAHCRWSSRRTIQTLASEGVPGPLLVGPLGIESTRLAEA